jgi:hypothetical protein
VSIGNTTDALQVVQPPSESRVQLSNNVKARHCDKHISASWSVCGASVSTGTACVKVSPPCPRSLSGTASDIACPLNIASQPPFPFTSQASLQLELLYDDGVTRAASYPPPNGAFLQVAVERGSDSCQVQYNGSAAPVVTAHRTASCKDELCSIRVSYNDSCWNTTLEASVPVRVVVAQCLQAKLQCHDAAAVSYGTPPPAQPLCSTESAQLRQLACPSAGFQQRTLWVAARLSAQTGLPDGVIYRMRDSAFLVCATIWKR